MDRITRELQQQLVPFEYAQRFVVACSGGMDSLVLLHALIQLKLPQKIVALHINHHLSPNADTWQASTAAMCQQLGVEFQARDIVVQRDGGGLEDAARNARYAVFEAFLESHDCLLSAHHRNDQVETLLLRLVRGSGPRGLSGMPRTRMLGDAVLLRPLINVPRRELAHYAAEHQLQWVEDESNSDEYFDRNFMRHSIVAPLMARWPQVLHGMASSAELCAESEQLNRELAEIDMFACYPQHTKYGPSLALGYMDKLSPIRRKNLLRYWIEHCGFPLPGKSRLAAIMDEVMEAALDAVPVVRWSGVECRRFRHRLYLLPCRDIFNAEGEWLLKAGEQLPIDGLGTLGFRVLTGGGFRANANEPLMVRFRQGGERCKPAGRSGSQVLKKLLQEYGVPPWERDRVPLIYRGQQLVAVGDVFVCEGSQAAEHEPGYLPQWQQVI